MRRRAPPRLRRASAKASRQRPSTEGQSVERRRHKRRLLAKAQTLRATQKDMDRLRKKHAELKNIHRNTMKNCRRYVKRIKGLKAQIDDLKVKHQQHMHGLFKYSRSLERSRKWRKSKFYRLSLLGTYKLALKRASSTAGAAALLGHIDHSMSTRTVWKHEKMFAANLQVNDKNTSPPSVIIIIILNHYCYHCHYHYPQLRC